MTELPANLIYFASLQGLSQILKKSALPLLEAHQLNDPFLPNRCTPIGFSVQQLFDTAVKHITHAILGKSPPRGQPNHPLIKAIMRWRMENRFNDESEVREALQGLLPAMVEQAFIDAEHNHQAWIDYVSSVRVIPFYETFQSLSCWENLGFAHKGVAIKFKCTTESLFDNCSAVEYSKTPAVTVNQKDFVEHLIGVLPEVKCDPQPLLLRQNYQHRQMKEWRLVVNAEDFAEPWIEFPESFIQSVYIGALVGDKNTEQLKNHLAKLNPQINVYRACCKNNEFSLDFDKISQT